MQNALAVTWETVRDWWNGMVGLATLNLLWLGLCLTVILPDGRVIDAGKPLVKVTALDAPTGAEVRRLGFMAGQISVPDDFDRMGSAEIERLFEGGDGA